MRNKIQLSLYLTLMIIGVQGKFASIYANPSVDFSYTGFCVGSPSIFIVDESVTVVADVTNYHWNFGDGLFSAEKNPVHTYAGPGTYTVTLTITDKFLLTGIVSHNIVIQKLPSPSFFYDTPNCVKDSIQFTDLSTTPDGYINEWKWNFDDGSPVQSILLPNSPDPKHIFPNDGIFNVSLTVVNSVNSCENTIFLPVTVTPGPVANFYFNGKCEDQVVAFTDASFANGAGNIAAWSWNFGDVTSGINNTSNLTNPFHNFNNPGTYTVSLKIRNFNGCTDSIVKQVIINPHPAIEFTNSTPCLGEPVFFNPDLSIINISSISAWRWDFGDGITSHAGNTSHPYSATGDYPVTFEVTDLLGCKNEVTHTIKVNPLPVAQFSTNLSYCAGSEVQFQDLSRTSVGYISSWKWDFGDGKTITIYQPDDPNISHKYALSGNYNVTLTVQSSEGCSSTGSHLIIIHSNPSADFSFTAACKGTPVDFTDLTQLNGALSIMQWQWSFGDPGSGSSNSSPMQNPQHTFVATGNSIVELIVTNGNGCIDTIQRTVQVNSPPQVNFNTVQNCQNKEVAFTPDAMVMNIATVASWYWEFGSGVPSFLQNPTHVFTSAGSHIVKLTIVDTSGCTNTISKPVIIASEPVVNFSFPQPACMQSPVRFDNLSNAPGSFIVKSEWDFGDGKTQTVTTLASVFHTFNTYGTYSIKLKITTNDGCDKTLALPITILPTPSADFAVSGTCLNTPAQFTDHSQPGVGGIMGWSWIFGDPASGTNNISSVQLPGHTYNTSGSFSVQLIVSNSGGCEDTIIKQVLVHALPAVDFTFTLNCVGGSTQFVSSAFVNAGAISSGYWNFGDGQSIQGIDPSHVYVNSGSYSVTLTVTDTAGCTSTKMHTVVIAEPPSALFEVSTQTCSGSPISFSLLPSASGSLITSFLWEFGDGSDTLIFAPASGNVSHIYASGNAYTAVLTVKTSLGCEAKAHRILTISPGPIAKFSYDNSCTGTTVSFNDLSVSNSGPAIANWSWNFNDPSSNANNTSAFKNPTHVFNTPGTYNVLLKVGNLSGCYSTVSKSIVINPKPAVDFDWSGSCIGSTKFSINNTVTNIAAIESCTWDFGDGTAYDNTQNPLHNYTSAGSYIVSLIVVSTSGCENSISKTIEISSPPNAYFSSNSSCLGTTTEFTDQSLSENGVPIKAWHWDFGVNSSINDTSALQNPSWIYKTMGVYQVKLTVTAQNGCKNTITLPSQVFGNPTANFTYTVSPCAKGAVYFQDSSYNKMAPIVSYDWEFESNHNSLQDPVYVFYSADSCYDVRLIAKDVRGCVDTVVKKACVPAEFNFSFEATHNCLFDSTSFAPLQMGTSTGTLVSFYWNFGDPKTGANNISTKKSPSHYYDQPGTYSVSLSAIDIYNCSKTIYRDITILPLPVSYFTYTEGACDSSVYFNEASYSVGNTISRWTWEYGDGVIKTIVDPDSPDLSHHYAAPGMYSVSLTVTNSTGCTSRITVPGVQVKPCLTAAFELYDTLICQNNILSFVDKSSTSNATNEWYWDFGDGTHIKYSSYTNLVNHKYTSAGNFKVQLILSTQVAGRKVSDTTRMSINVNPTPLPDFIFGVVCHEQTAIFTNMTSGNGTKITSYNWTFGEPQSDVQDTSTLKNPSHLFNSPGSYDITLVVKNSLGCMDSARKSLIVHGLPEANYTYSVSCAGKKTSFTDLSIAAVAPLASWEWTFYNEKGVAGRTGIQSPEFVFADPGDYHVNLKVIDVFGCMDTINQQVTTWKVPKSSFDFKENFDNVQGQLQFVNNSLDATMYHWDFGNGTESYIENPLANYENDGTYDIILMSSNDNECTDTLSMKYEFMVKSLYIPNAFSPENPKTEVQLLKPIGINLEEYLFEVYDRWGNLLWWTDKLDDAGRPAEGWDGKYKDNLMPEGAYPWRATGVFRDGTIWEGENVGNTDHLPSTKVGTATMIR